MPEPWWYLKRRNNPIGVLGRPRSPVPLSERRRLARRNYRTRLASRGMRSVRLLLPAETAARLRDLARQRGLSLGQLLTELLGPAS